MLKNIEGRQNIPVMDVLEPQLYRDVFPYEEIPKIRFNNAFVPYNLPETIWITDTTFRDGQQSMACLLYTSHTHRRSDCVLLLRPVR